MILLAMPGNIAEKIAGRLAKGQSISPRYVGFTNSTEWFVLDMDTLRDIGLQLKNADKTRFDAIKARFQALIDDGTIKKFDTEDISNPITRKWLALKTENGIEQQQRLVAKVTTWDYLTKEVTL